MGKQKKKLRKYAHKPHKLVKPKKQTDNEEAPNDQSETEDVDTKKHVQDLKDLAETQSEFLDFLAKEDSGLLNFEDVCY